MAYQKLFFHNKIETKISSTCIHVQIEVYCLHWHSTILLFEQVKFNGDFTLYIWYIPVSNDTFPNSLASSSTSIAVAIFLLVMKINLSFSMLTRYLSVSVWNHILHTNYLEKRQNLIEKLFVSQMRRIIVLDGQHKAVVPKLTQI